MFWKFTAEAGKRATASAGAGAGADGSKSEGEDEPPPPPAKRGLGRTPNHLTLRYQHMYGLTTPHRLRYSTQLTDELRTDSKFMPKYDVGSLVSHTYVAP